MKYNKNLHFNAIINEYPSDFHSVWKKEINFLE